MWAHLRRSPVLTAHLLLLAVVLVWGTTFTLVKSALRDISPLLFNLLRMLLAFAALAGLSWRQLRSTSRAELLSACGAGVFLGLGYQFQTAGLARTTPTKSAFITGLVVVLVPLLGVIRYVRPPEMAITRWNGFAGALLAFAGLVLLTTLPGSTAMLSGFGIGEMLTLGCALAFAAHLLLIAHISRMNARRLGTIQVGAAAIFMLITLPLEGHLQLRWNKTVVLALVITSLFATAAAFTIQSWAQKHIAASHAALIFTLEPVFAWVTSLLFLHERLTSRSIAGACLILLGILLSELWPKNRNASATLPIVPLAP